MTDDVAEGDLVSEILALKRRAEGAESQLAEALGLLDRCCRILEEQALEPFEWRETYRMVREFRSRFSVEPTEPKEKES